MSRPAVEVADILRAQGNASSTSIEKSLDFQQLKAVPRHPALPHGGARRPYR